ncbi:hypothetical protein P7C71_g17, partial [Lecanoromycetidae sp. Uapishka_2]
MDFDAIWISPITKQIDNPSRAYHGYSQQDIYQLNSNFGTEQDLKDLSAALHARGMYLMVDVVTNHFGFDGDISSVDYSTMNPFNTASDYHSFCEIEDGNNITQITLCDLGSASYPLPDVDTTLDSVRTEYNSWIQQLISTYNIDGLRIDSVKNVEIGFWSGFQKAAEIYAVGEVSDGRVDVACPYQDSLDGILNYPMFYQLTYFFNGTQPTSANLINLMQAVNSTSGCTDPTLMAPFSENHDQPRFANYTDDKSLAVNVAAFTILADGIPIIYSGQEQSLAGGNDPYNREAIWLQGYTDNPLYTHIKSLNHVRKQAISKSSAYVTERLQIIYSDDRYIVTNKGPTGSNIVAVYNNLGDTASRSLSLTGTGFKASGYVIDVLSCSKVQVGSDGTLTAVVVEGMPLVFASVEMLAGSGMCGQ